MRSTSKQNTLPKRFSTEVSTGKVGRDECSAEGFIVTFEACSHTRLSKQFMRRLVLRNGAIAGLIVSVIMLITSPLIHQDKISYDAGMLIGYAAMISRSGGRRECFIR